MKRKLISVLVMVLSVAGIQAATEETTLWEGKKVFENYNGLEIDKGNFATVAAGDVITVTITACEESDAKFAFKQKDNGWKELTGFEWVDVTEPFEYQYTVTETTATELKSYGLAIQGNNITVTKVKLIQTVPDPITITTLWSGTEVLGEWANFEDLRYGGKGELANAKVGDDIRVTFTNATEGWQVYVCDAASYGEFTDGYFAGSAQEEAQTVSFRIANATVLEAIQDRGIVVKGKLVTLTKIEIVTYTTSYDAVAVTIGDDGIATFSSSKHLDFAGTGVTPYYASAVTTGKVTLTSTTTTWAWQGYILKGSADTYTVPVTAEANAYYPSTNYLKQMANGGTVAASTGSTFHYIFAKKKEGDANIGFYKLTADHTLDAKKAYLETGTDITPTGDSARVLMVFDDGQTTSIDNIQGRKVDEGIYYNLRGQRVQNPTKGLYVVNGKKVIIK